MEVILRQASIRRARAQAKTPTPQIMSTGHCLCGVGLLACALLLTATALDAETGYNAWLRYAEAGPSTIPASIATLNDSPILTSARTEMIRGVRGTTGKILRIDSGIPKESAIVLGTLDKLPAQWHLDAKLETDAYWLKSFHQ